LLKWILFSLLFTNLFALEISIDGAQENFETYSTLHIKDSKNFLCQEEKNDYDKVTKIVCAFAKQPSELIRTIQNNFFEISSVIKKKTFFLIIRPYKKMKLFPIVFNLSKEDDVYQPNVKLSQHWMIIGYKKKLPYIKNEKRIEGGIDFPFVMKDDKLPFVGSLDIKGNPVHIQKVQDVQDYLKIKKLYKQKKYDLCLEVIDDITQEYPNSLFKAELLFYKIRVYSKLDDNDNVIGSSKIFLREYSSDENVPEILSLNANAYSKIGLSIDADYFFDRLFSEHKESIYSHWGYIYKGEILEQSGSASKALSFYKKALNETENIEVGATAAYRLALYYSSASKEKLAANYVMKIINANPDFFMHYFKKSLDLMYLFVDEGDYTTASAMAKAILANIDKNNDEYERLLKDRGIWLSKTDNKHEALVALKKYIKEYLYGSFEEEVKVAKDSLFFDVTDENATARLVKYNELISEYMADSIGNRATYEKAELLLEEKMYGDVLGFKEDILDLDREKYNDVDTIIIDAATGLMMTSLEHNECHEVLSISNEYNITLSNKWDDGIYKCAMKGGDYTLAKTTANKNLKSKDLEIRKKWLYRYIKIDFTTGNYSDVIDASKDLITLIKDDIAKPKNNIYKEVYRYIFDTYERLEKSEKMLIAIAEIEKVYGTDYKDIDRYIAVMAIGDKLKNDNIVIKYASMVMKIQKDSSSYAQSPFLEFTLYQAYISKEDYNTALETIKSLDSVELNKPQRSRQKYLLGSVYSKLWRDKDATKAYEAAIEADPSGVWAELATSAKNI